MQFTPTYQQELTENYQRELRIAKTSLAKKEDKSQKSVHKSVKDFYKRIDKQIAGNIEKHKIKLVCKRGCSHCCTLRVEVFGYEVTSIAKHIQDTFSEEEKAEIKKKLAEASEKSRGLKIEDHSTPCACLRNGECSIYSMRPAMCRKYHSLSLETCLSTNQGVENTGLKETTMASIQGFADGVRQAGLRNTLYELNQALHIAVNEPSAGKRWLSGSEVFTPIPKLPR